MTEHAYTYYNSYNRGIPLCLRKFKYLYILQSKKVREIIVTIYFFHICALVIRNCELNRIWVFVLLSCLVTRTN